MLAEDSMVKFTSLNSVTWRIRIVNEYFRPEGGKATYLNDPLSFEIRTAFTDFVYLIFR
ncbi:hypothetical protein LEP1GSC058_0051 [Leptospira fainei serovar Hurstbridge str. BUT 6]|uniref:Uncharacterized protein n=1 Tax=Leptospira fainei serovar Hurstbridge str. BUT 6 TaxID=1193011 RepID=S3W4G8_9LEPT|nr:hypothetical protein LEP1GSC058_0051 [Leptospira fainei serovar Hurstbridge str. BUT 6]